MAKHTNHLKTINRRYELVFGLGLAAFLIILAGLDQRDETNLIETVSIDHTTIDKNYSHKASAVKGYDSQLEDSKHDLIKSLQVSATQVTEKTPSVLIDEVELLRWIKTDNFSDSHQYLMTQAAAAVDLNDHQQLGLIMRILAQVSASQGDLASAEVYLFEALEIFKQLNSDEDLAKTNLLIGQMYAKRRQIAQMAGWAYGDLLMARFYLSKGSHYQAKDTLDASIQDNLKLGRTGAVASAYKTMARYYRAVNDYTGEQNALIEAGKYYAHSGQSYQAQQVIQQLYEQQAPQAMIESLEQQIEMRLSSYESQINIVRQARDYMQLYSLYKSKGEHGRAWQFRIKASEILSRTNKRDMYFRMPDVMAVLYDSNFNIVKASNHYKQASDYYLSQNQLQAHQRAEELISTLN